MVNNSQIRRYLVTLLGLCFLTLLCVGGCRLRPLYIPMMGAYYLNPDVDLKQLGRVALVEFENHSRYPDVSNTVGDALYIALQKKQRFGLTVVEQKERVWQSLQTGPDESYSPEVLKEMRDLLKTDAVLTGVITQYEPYPHTTIGLRMKLIDLRDGRLLWAVEQLWDGNDRKTCVRIKNYQDYLQKTGKTADAIELVTTSPRKFMKFVAFEVGETL